MKKESNNQSNILHNNDDNLFAKKFNNFNQKLSFSKKEIIESLKKVFDPEIPVNIYDLGLIYKIDLDKNSNIKIMMTLTTPNCPVAEEMPSMVSNSIEELEAFNSIEIKLVWDPPWNKDMMSEDAKLALDIT